MIMNYSIKVNVVKSKDSNVKGYATVVFGDSFKVTKITILENKEKGELFVSMPRFRSNEVDSHGNTIYKDVCNPITAEFREELYTNILTAYENTVAKNRTETKAEEQVREEPSFSVGVTPYEREGSNIRGLARIYLEDQFVVSNVNILQGKEKLFVAMPSYKTKQTDKNGNPTYQDVCYPVTKEFREKLYKEIEQEYEKKVQEQKQNRGSNERSSDTPIHSEDRGSTPFR